MAGRIEGKVAIVTGGARGLGRGIAAVLAEEGADIAIADVKADEAVATVAVVEEAGRKAIVVETDVTDSASAAGCIAAVIAQILSSVWASSTSGPISAI